MGWIEEFRKIIGGLYKNIMDQDQVYAICTSVGGSTTTLRCMAVTRIGEWKSYHRLKLFFYLAPLDHENHGFNSTSITALKCVVYDSNQQ